MAAKSVSGSFFKTKFTHSVCTHWTHHKFDAHFTNTLSPCPFLPRELSTLYTSYICLLAMETPYLETPLKSDVSSVLPFTYNLPNTPKNIQNDPPLTTVHELVLFTTWDGPSLKASRMILDCRCAVGLVGLGMR